MTESIASVLRSSLNVSSGPRLRRTSQLLPLEQRFMFDGAAVADAAHAAQTPDAAAAAAPALPPAVTVREAEPAKDNGKKEVVLVDTSLADYKTLEAGVRDGVGIVEFDGSKDGLAQIAQWASTQSGLDAIHILSHGSEGVLNLGTAHLTESTLTDTTTQAELAQLGGALAADGDLMLYGCDSGDSTALLNGLAQATGADVAASTDVTGAAKLGGNWMLEAHVGDIDTQALALTQYDGLLDTVSFIYGIDGDDNGFDIDGNGQVNTITKGVGGTSITFASGGPELYIYGDGNGLFSMQGDRNSISLTLTIGSGYSFDLNSLKVASYGDSLVISYIDVNGIPGTLTPSIPGSGDGLLHPITTSLQDVTSVTLTSPDFTTFQDFIITDVKPLLPYVSSAQLSADTAPNGATNTDFITGTAAQTISGTLSANLGSGQKVEVSYDNGQTWSDATSYTVGSSTWSTTTTLAGSSTFQARVSDASNSTTPYTHTYTLDTTAPTVTLSGVSLSQDTGTSSTDFITKTATQIITATLSAPPGAGEIVYGSVDNGAHWTNITSSVSGTTLNWSTTLNAGTGSIVIKVSDGAGNDGSLSTHTYTLDTTAPATTASGLDISADTGNNTDFITQTAAQTITATLSGAPAGTDVVYGSVDNGATWTNITSQVSGTTVSWTTTLISNGSNTIKIKVIDVAGNDGTILAQAYTVDSTPPTTPATPVLSAGSDNGVSSSDHITNDTTPTLVGTAESGSTVTLYDGATQLGTVVATGGNWSYTTAALSSGTHTFTATATDTAGNVSAASAGLNVTLDSTAPVVSSVSVPPSGSYPAGSTLTFTVHTDENVYIDASGGTPRLQITVGGTTRYATYLSGSGSADLVFTYTVQAGETDSDGITINGLGTNGGTITDQAGNAIVTTLASVGATNNVLVDTTAPATTSVAVPASATYYSGDTLDFTVNFEEAVTVDTTGGTPRIAIVVGATTRYAEYVAGSGSSALLFRYTVPSGDIDANGVTVGALNTNGGTVKDSAGNNAVTTLNNVGSTAAVNVDGSNPSVINVAASTADGSYGAGSTITITVDFSTAVDVDTTGGIPTLTLDDGGTASYTGGSGSSTLTFSYTVGAGQNSADLDYSSSTALALNGATIVDAGGAHTNAAVTLAAPGTAGSLGANKDLVIDTAAPTNSVATASFSVDSGTLGNDFVTKTAAQTISGTLAANLAAGENVYVSLDNGASWNLATATPGANTWSLAGQTLTGSGTLKVRITDDAGNNGPAYAQAYVLDTTAPSISFSGIELSADTGASNTDLITSTAAQTISATLSAAPAAGDIVYGSLDNGATWTDITSKVSGTALTWNGVTLASSDTLKLRVTDAAGNDGAATSAAYVLDTTGPGTSVAGVSFNHDSGGSSTDFITNEASQIVSGTLSANLSAGERVLVSLDNGATWSVASATIGSNSWSLAGQTLVSSDTLLVKVSDQAGNDGAVLSQAYVYDTAATVPGVDALQTPSLTPVLTGTATLAAGETMTVTVGGATYDVVPVAGAWSLDLASAVPSSGALTLVLNTQYSVTATVTDLAGNVASDTTSNELIVGTLTPPSPPATEGFQTPPVYPEPLPPITAPVSWLPPPPGVTEQITPPPAFDFGSGTTWTSPTLFSDALQPSAELSGGFASLFSPGAGKATAGGREALSIGTPVDNMTVASGERISKQIDAEAFMHNMPGQNVVLSADLADGRPLPGWLKFNARDGRFEGTPPPGFSGKLIVRVTARDGLGHEATQQFEIVIGGNKQAQSSAPVEANGRTSLSQQLRDARSLGSSRLADLAAASNRAT